MANFNDVNEANVRRAKSASERFSSIADKMVAALENEPIDFLGDIERLEDADARDLTKRHRAGAVEELKALMANAERTKGPLGEPENV